jgi:hypothetical protein
MSTDLIQAGTEIQVGVRSVVRVNYTRNNLRRTMEDIGVLVNGDEHYIQANPGEGMAEFMKSNGLHSDFPMPKAKRTYDAAEFTFTRRFGGGFFGSASYVWSRLYGNYPGLASSDEISSPSASGGSTTTQQQGGSTARPGGNTNRAFDLDEVLFDSHGNIVEGRLPTDRPHVLKLYGSKQLNWGGFNASDIGVFFYAGSGTPLSTYVNTINQTEVFVEGRGDMGRTPVLTQTDLVVGHEFKIGEVKRLRFEFNALNVFNQKTARHSFNWLNRGAAFPEAQSAINLADTDLFKGYDYRSMLNSAPDQLSGRGAFDPRYGMADIFNPGFQGRFGVKFTF